MFRLPVCPHCGTVYRYRDTKQAIIKKENVCYHCQKKFKARIFPYLLVGALIPLALCIGFNIFLLSRMTDLELLPLFAATLVGILIIYLIIPFFTKFKKINEDIDEKLTNRKS
ncbi:MAG: hypothetical protein IJG87_10100 [Ruminococcus sp.]|nr:hypothetical protein [Ruminococcus sp.]